MVNHKCTKEYFFPVQFQVYNPTSALVPTSLIKEERCHTAVCVLRIRSEAIQITYFSEKI